MLTSFFTKLVSFLMSLWLAIAGFFGFAETPETPDDTRDIKNVIFLIANGENLNNYEIPKRIAQALDFEESEFPASVNS